MATAPRQRPEERRLLEWCRLQGVVLDGVKLDGRRLVATRDLAVGHCAISVPKAAVLSTDPVSYTHLTLPTIPLV